MFGQGGINYGVIGVVHTVSGPLIEATPIDEVLKYLEQFENNRYESTIHGLPTFYWVTVYTLYLTCL